MDLLHILSLSFLLSLGLVTADRKEEYSQIQQEIERISRDLEVEHHFNRVEDQISDNSLSESLENSNDEDVSGRQQARCEYEEECYKSGYWGGIVCDCSECCSGDCHLSWNWVSWPC